LARIDAGHQHAPASVFRQAARDDTVSRASRSLQAFYAMSRLRMRTLLVLTASLAATGCFSSVTVLRVRADGSGTIELTTTLRKAALVKMAEMMPARRQIHRPDDWFPDHMARDAASNMGAHVRVLSTRALDDADALGRVTTYAFDDVRQLTLEIIPMFPLNAGGGGSASFVGDSHFSFDLVEESDRRVLVARFPDAQIEHSGADVPVQVDAYDAQQEALLRTLVGGGRLELAIEPEQAIVRTNTPHRSGQRVTLLAIDAERLFLDPESSDRIRVRPASIDELRYQLHDAAGVTVALDRDIRIELAVR
jgi:hypothetical protein